MRRLLDATDESDRLVGAGALGLGLGLGWLIHPAFVLIMASIALIAAGVLRALTEAE